MQLNDLIKPTWHVEKKLQEAWAFLDPSETLQIKARVDKLFYHEIPFQLQHDKIIYVHLFSLVAQIEAIGLSGLIKCLPQLSGTKLYTQMRQQIVDEIFHLTVFTKITLQLSAPYALPIGHENSIIQLIGSLQKEEDLGTGLIFVNLVGEVFFEALFRALIESNTAVSILETVLEDESRHANEYDLYKHIGLPSKAYLKQKLAFFEDELLKAVFSQEEYVLALVTVLGRDGFLKFVHVISQEHDSMLKKIGLTPSSGWQFSMQSMPHIIDALFHPVEQDIPVQPTAMRKVLSSFWRDPELPTESALFSLDVTKIGFFEKKFGPETITCLMLQAISKMCFDNPPLRNYMANHKIYTAKDSLIGLAVKLPECDDQIGAIEFKNCHEMSMDELAKHIHHDMKIMVYCYQKVQLLQAEYPHLTTLLDKLLISKHTKIHANPLYVRPAVSLSNIGHWGYEAAISPLFPNEAVKCTITKVERKQVWNKTSQTFEVRDILPVGISVDHRFWDGNIPIPHYVQMAFDGMLGDMVQSTPKSQSMPFSDLRTFIKASDTLLENDLEMGFRLLFYFTNVWKNNDSMAHLMESVNLEKTASALVREA